MTITTDILRSASYVCGTWHAKCKRLYLRESCKEPFEGFKSV